MTHSSRTQSVVISALEKTGSSDERFREQTIVVAMYIYIKDVEQLVAVKRGGGVGISQSVTSDFGRKEKIVVAVIDTFN